MSRAPSKERKELFCGTREECADWIEASRHLREPESVEIVNNTTGPECSVFRKRRQVDKTIKAPVRRLTREEFKTKGGKRPLWVSLDPGDVITFCPKGTRQRVTVPIASLYHFARFTAARALVAARKAAKKSKK